MQINDEDLALVGLDSMQDANSTLEDFVSIAFQKESLCYCCGFVLCFRFNILLVEGKI